MTQYIIDIGAYPDDGQGSPLRTAFDYVNLNFDQIFAAGPVLSNIQIGNNTITTTVLNSNLILSPSGIGRVQFNSTVFPGVNNVYDMGTPVSRFNTLYLGSGGIDSQGGIGTSGNITANYFIGNGSLLTGIVATTGSQVVNGNTVLDIPSPGSNIVVTVNNTGNIVTFADSGVYVVGEVSATGNISGNYILGNGALLTGINIGYGNSNVADFLPTYTGNLASLTGPVTTTANITGGNIRTAGQISATGNIVGGNVNTGRLNAGYVTVGTTISAVGNISTSGYFIGDGSLLTGINADYGNANVAAFLPTYSGNLPALTGLVSTTGNVVGSNLRTSGSLLVSGNITGGNVDTGRVNAANVTVSGPVSAVGNVSTAGFFVGDGSKLTNLPAGNYSNANVAAFLPTYTGTLPSLTGVVRTTGPVEAGNASVTGNIVSGNLDTGRVNAGSVTTTGLVSAVGNIVTAGFFVGDGSKLINLPPANYSNANVAAFLPTYTGNLVSLTGPVTTTANVTGGNIVTSGQVVANGNVTAGNIDTARVNAANVTVSGPVSAQGNISTAGFFVGDGSLLTNLPAGNYSNANVAAFLPTYTGNLPNLTGLVRTTGNIGAANASVTGNVVAGNVDAARVNAANVTVSSLVSSQGNIVTAGFFVGDGSQLTNLPAGNYSNANVAAFLPTYTGNLPSLTGLVATSGNIRAANASVIGNIVAGNVDTARVNAANVTVSGPVSAQGNITTTGFFVGDGSQLTNLPAGNYSNANVAAFLPTYTGNLSSLTGPVTTTANITGGNILTSGLISAVGNITGGNVDASQVNANIVTVNNTLSSAGNIFGNLLVGNAVVGQTVTAVANVVAGNISTSGQISATGNVTGGNFNAPGGTLTSYLVSATGRIQGGSFVTNGFITATGNITGGNVDTGNIHAGNINVDLNISAIGNVYASNFIGSGLSTTGNVSANNIVATGLISTAGNIAANYLIGNGALITGITANAGTKLQNGTSNVVVSYNSNVDVGVAGVGNVATFYNAGVDVLGQISATGNVIGNYILGNGALLTGVTASSVNANALIGDTLSSNVLYSSLTSVGNLTNLSVVGNIATGGILTDNYYYANGTPVPTGIIYTAALTPPAGPGVGDQWYDTSSDVLYEYITDGTSNYWVDTNSPAFAGGVVANVAISGNMLPVANVSFDIGNSSAYFNTAFLQTASVAGNVVAGTVNSPTVVATILSNPTAINLQTNGTNALSIDSNQNITTYQRFAASSMPVGSVVQTVMSSILGGSITNSTSYADVSYATVTITPSSATSKIVILATGTTSFTPVSGANVQADTQLVRSPAISLQIQSYSSNVAGGGIGGTSTIAYSYQDSPGTTSPITYKLQQKISNSLSTLTSTNIWLIAMEIAA